MKILFIGAHYDDIELGCGGTMIRHIEAGDKVFYLGLSNCGNELLNDECIESIKILSIPTINLHLDNFNFRYFSNVRQGILNTLIEIGTAFKPDLVYTHSQHDRHQDHAVVGQESLRAFRNTSILTYTHSHNRINQVDNHFVVLSEAMIDKKIEALKCYKSQADKRCMSPDYIYSTAMIAGGMVGTWLAESFYTERIIV
jgi:LmbE family N-acetylglucosaminyl deacetylase